MAVFQLEHRPSRKALMIPAAPSDREQDHGEIQNRKSVGICASDEAARWRDAWDARNGTGARWRFRGRAGGEGPLSRRSRDDAAATAHICDVADPRCRPRRRPGTADRPEVAGRPPDVSPGHELLGMAVPD